MDTELLPTTQPVDWRRRRAASPPPLAGASPLPLAGLRTADLAAQPSTHLNSHQIHQRGGPREALRRCGCEAKADAARLHRPSLAG